MNMLIIIDTNPLRLAREQKRTAVTLTLAYHDRKPFSYRELAERLEVSHRHIERWERGESIPSPSNAAKLAKTLGFKSADDLRLALIKWQLEHVPERVRETHKRLLSKRPA